MIEFVGAITNNRSTEGNENKIKHGLSKIGGTSKQVSLISNSPFYFGYSLKKRSTKHTLNNDKFILIFNGYITNREDFRISNSTRQATNMPLAGILLHTYQQEGIGFISRINGVFNLLLFDKTINRLFIANDRYGLQPLYMVFPNSGIYFSSALRGLLNFDDIKKDIDEEAVAQFAYIGFVMGKKTLLQNVKVLPPGSILTYHLPSKKKYLTSYWNPSTIKQANNLEPYFSEKLRQSFINANHRVFKGYHNFGISLSGGLDSRAIISALPESIKKLKTFTLGVTGCTDERVATAVSKEVGVPSFFDGLKSSFHKNYIDLFNQSINLTDGQVSSHGAFMVQGLKQFINHDIDIIVRGHGGELIKAKTMYLFNSNNQIKHFNSDNNIAKYILARSAGFNEKIYDNILNLKSGSAFNTTQEILCNKLSSINPTSDIENRLYLLFLQEYVSKRTANSLKMIRSISDVRLPFFDNEFIDTALEIPIKYRLGSKLHTYIIEKNYPSLIPIENVNTGVPMNAGKLHSAIGDIKMRVFRKMGIMGYKNYMDMNLWIRKDIRNVADQLIFERKEWSGYFNPIKVKKLLQDHLENKVNAGEFLERVMTFENWYSSIQ